MCLRANTIYPGNIEKKSALSSEHALAARSSRTALPLWSAAGREKPHHTEFRSRKKSAIGRLLIEEEEKEEEEEEEDSKGVQKEDDRDDRERNGNAREIVSRIGEENFFLFFFSL